MPQTRLDRITSAVTRKKTPRESREGKIRGESVVDKLYRNTRRLLFAVLVGLAALPACATVLGNAPLQGNPSSPENLPAQTPNPNNSSNTPPSNPKGEDSNENEDDYDYENSPGCWVDGPYEKPKPHCISEADPEIVARTDPRI